MVLRAARPAPRLSFCDRVAGCDRSKPKQFENSLAQTMPGASEEIAGSGQVVRTSRRRLTRVEPTPPTTNVGGPIGEFPFIVGVLARVVARPPRRCFLYHTLAAQFIGERSFGGCRQILKKCGNKHLIEGRFLGLAGKCRRPSFRSTGHPRSWDLPPVSRTSHLGSRYHQHLDACGLV